MRPLTACEAILLRFRRKRRDHARVRPLPLVNAFRVCDNQPISGLGFENMRVSGRRISILNISNERFLQIAVLTAAGIIGTSSQADAALYYWQDNDPGYYREVTPVQPRRQKVRRQTSRKGEVTEK